MSDEMHITKVLSNRAYRLQRDKAIEERDMANRAAHALQSQIEAREEYEESLRETIRGSTTDDPPTFEQWLDDQE
jgi:outer membrane protein TolC